MKKYVPCDNCEDTGYIEVKRARRDGTVAREEVQCKECCDHEFDPSEGYTCLNCNVSKWD